MFRCDMAPKAAAQRSKSYRKRLKDDPEKYAQYLQSEKERYRRRRETGKLKSVSLLSTREHRYEKKRWKVNQQRKRAKDREKREIENYLSMSSPPESPDIHTQENQNRDVPNARNERVGMADSVQTPKQRGCKKVNRNKRKVYYDLQKSQKAGKCLAKG